LPSLFSSVYTDGAICLDILANQWSPIYDVAAILASIQSLLTDPNPNSPANVEAAKLYVENRREYDRKVAEVIEGLWKLEEAEKDSDDDDEEGEDDENEEEDDPEAAPRKKQKLTEATASSGSTATSSDSAAPAASATTTAAASAAAAAAASAPASSNSSQPAAAAQ